MLDLHGWEGFSLVVVSGGYCLLQCLGSWLVWLLLSRSMGSLHGFRSRGGLSSWGSQALELRLNSCSTRASLLCGTWDLPRSGTEPVSPALAGRFCTPEPPGKPKIRVLELRMQALFCTITPPTPSFTLTPSLPPKPHRFVFKKWRSVPPCDLQLQPINLWIPGNL